MNIDELTDDSIPNSLKEKIDSDFLFVINSLMKNSHRLNASLIMELDKIINLKTSQEKQERLSYWAEEISKLRTEKKEESSSSEQLYI